MHHLRLLLVLGRLALFMFLPIWMVYDLKGLVYDTMSGTIEPMTSRVMGLLLFDGVLSWLQNIVAFSVLSIVTPLTYAVASASKRIFVIAVTLFILGNPVTGLNIFGMTLAISGVLCYNKAKYDQRRLLKKEALLPRYTEVGKTESSHHNGWTSGAHRLYAI